MASAGLSLALALALTAGAASAAKPPQFSLATGVTLNNNITLLSQDVNFGPQALARDDVIGHVRVDAYHRAGPARFSYALTRSHFFRNETLHYLNQYFRGSYEKPGWAGSYYRLSLDYNRFDPDHRATPDALGQFPFTTTELPNRRVYGAVVNQAITRRDHVQVQGVSKSIWYENNPVIDNLADGGVLRLSHRFGKAWTGFVEAGENVKRYPNLSGFGGIPAQLKTPQEHEGGGMSWVPNQKVGGLLKFTRLQQSANIREFGLDQWDLSLIFAYTPKRGPSAFLTTQRSRKAFPERPVASGAPQDDHQVLANLQVNYPLWRDTRASMSLTYDRNASNNTEFDYVNRIAVLELREWF
jgi:hypothetical protein